MRHQRSPEEVAEAFHENISALKASSASFDQGNEWEAKRLATAIYTLVNDGGKRNLSILTQMGVLKTMDWIETGRPLEENTATRFTVYIPPLVVVSLANGQKRFSKNGRDFPSEMEQKPFSRWWSSTVFTNSAGQNLSRKNLVASMRNQDNGSHFDAELRDIKYMEMKSNNVHTDNFGFLNEATGEVTSGETIPNAHLATVRQIAEEVLISLEQSGHI